MLIGLQYTRFLREDLAATFGAHALAAGASSKVTPAGAFSGSKAVVALLLGLRWNPMRGDLRTQAIRPYLAAGFGPVIGASSGSSKSYNYAFAGSQSAATAGGHVGAGVDVLIGRSWSIGVNAGYNLMADFSKPIGSRYNYNGFEAAVNLGWLFGKGYRARN
jgi:outer membrane autotransporter protein